MLRWVVFVLAGAAAGLTAQNAPELRVWLPRLADEATRAEAAAALVAGGATAAELLVGEFAAADTAQQVRYLEVLAELGPAAGDAVVDLVGRGVPDAEETWAALGVAALATLPYSAAFWERQPEQPILKALGNIGMIRGRRNHDARNALVRSLQTLSYVRLEGLDPLDVAKLSEALRSKRPGVQAWATTALGFLGAEARAALPALAKRIIFSVPKRPRAIEGMRSLPFAEAMLAIDPAAPDSVVGHAYYLLYHPIAARRLAAARAIAHAGGARPREVAPQLVAALADSDPRVVGEVVTALGFYGPLDEAILARLREFAAGDDAELAARASATLRQLAKGR